MGFKGSKVQTFSSRPTGKSGTYVKTRVPFLYSPLLLFTPPPRVTGPFSFPAGLFSPAGDIFCRLTCHSIGVSLELPFLSAMPDVPVTG